MKPVGCCSGERIPPPPNGGPPPFSREAYILLANAVFKKLPAFTGKHLNINTTCTGKGNSRRWRAPGGQRVQRANFAGRFRCGCTRKYTLRVNPSTSFAGPPPLSGEAYLANAVKIKVTRLHQKTLEYQHYRYRQGQLAALASPRRTARYERIPPDGFRMAALENCCPWASPRGDVGIAPYRAQEVTA